MEFLHSKWAVCMYGGVSIARARKLWTNRLTIHSKALNWSKADLTKVLEHKDKLFCYIRIINKKV